MSDLSCLWKTSAHIFLISQIGIIIAFKQYTSDSWPSTTECRDFSCRAGQKGENKEKLASIQDFPQ